MPSQLQACLFGFPSLTWQGKALAVTSQKALACLYFLALNNREVNRDELVELLWGVGYGRNLRQMLTMLRQIESAKEWLSDGDPLQLKVECDVTQFSEAVQNEAYEEALLLYKGPLLEGFKVTTAFAFQDWLTLERERLQELYMHCLSARAAELEQEGQLPEALLLLKKLVLFDPLEEDYHRRVMYLEWKQGNVKQALRQFEELRRILAQDLGLEPVASTLALFESIRSQSASPSFVVEGAGHFVGREQELAELEGLLKSQRLVSLLGPGGVGKTRLAKAFAQSSELSKSTRVVFVSLASLRDSRFIPAAIANSLRIAFKGPTDPLLQLAEALKTEPTVLILDNLEQLLAAAEMVKTLLAKVDHLKLLISSRRALELEQEHKFFVQGLAAPKDEHDPDAAATDAVRLFVRAAHAIDPSFTLSNDNKRAIFRICGLLQGLPLGLELAAGWLRFYDCHALEETLRSDVLQLENPGLALQERHSSLRYVIEHSWICLTESEKRVLASLAVCRGGFDLQAARVIAGADLKLLSSLVNQSLLRLNSQGRYERHPLVYAFSYERLQILPSSEEIAERHARHYLKVLNDQRSAIMGKTPAPALQRVEGDFENIRAAWLFAARASWHEALQEAIDTLSLYADMRVRFHDAIDLFDDTLAKLEASPAAKRTQAFLLAAKGTHLYRLSRYQEALELADEAMQDTDLEDAELQDSLMRLKATCFYGLADYRKSKALFEEMVGYSRMHRLEQLSRDLRAVANLDCCLGAYKEAEALYNEAIELDKKNGYLVGLAINLNNLSELLILTGRFDEAKRCIEESFTYAQGSDIHLLPYLNLNKAQLAFAEQAFELAQEYALICQTQARDNGQLNLQSRSATLLAQLALQESKLALATEQLQTAVRLAATADSKASLMHAFVVQADLTLQTKDTELAVLYLKTVMQNPATEYADQDKAKTLLESLEGVAELIDSEQSSSLEVLIQKIVMTEDVTIERSLS